MIARDCLKQFADLTTAFPAQGVSGSYHIWQFNLWKFLNHILPWVYVSYSTVISYSAMSLSIVISYSHISVSIMFSSDIIFSHMFTYHNLQWYHILECVYVSGSPVISISPMSLISWNYGSSSPVISYSHTCLCIRILRVIIFSHECKDHILQWYHIL